eukprot:TRINITY_DN8080_c0_g1_i1.p1 TRINITY_DN8080_c0_g1~~TRINITY_DN8080_c0_g1_i1.p1  ORF type:complete len:691 (+),score=223.21 TRINITY_DN8080_c0_g1_i1:310-2073(+)
MDVALTEADNLGAAIEEILKTQTSFENDKAEAKKTRAEEKKAYETMHKDYSESIYATGKAVDVLKKELASQEAKSAALALLTTAKLISTGTTAKVAAFFQGFESVTADEKGKKKGDDLDFPLDSSTSGITEMLRGLQDKFKSQRAESEKEEIIKKSAHEKLLLELGNSLDTATASRSQKAQLKSKEEAIAAQKKASLEDAQATKQDDEKYLQEVTVECLQKKKDFVARSDLRKGEIDAMGQAVVLLTGDEVKKAEENKASKKGTSLVSLRSSVPSATQEKVFNFLSNMGDKLSSSLLSSAAMRVEKDPLKKVRDMLQSLVTRLEEERRASETQNQWCTSEMANNKKTRTDSSNSVERYSAEVEEAESKVAKLGSDVADLETQLAENSKSLANATEIREAEKKANEAAIADAKDAKTAILSAKKVLADFYKTAEKSAALIQTGGKIFAGQPKVFDKSYKGMQEKSGGVQAMLDVIEADYAKTEEMTSLAEEGAAKAFKNLKSEMAVLKAQQEKDVQHKSKEKLETENSIVTTKNDLEIATKELTAAKEYFDKLKETCMASGPTHEERQARRKEEIKSLSEALEMLSEE